jgi:hypothetical protein
VHIRILCLYWDGYAAMGQARLTSGSQAARVGLAAVAAAILLAALPAYAGAGTPAAIDQYVETPPGNLGNPGGGGDRGPGRDGSDPAPAAVPGLPAGVPAVGPATATSPQLERTSETSTLQTGGGVIPGTGYPATPLVLLLLLLLAIAAAVAVARKLAAKYAQD